MPRQLVHGFVTFCVSLFVTLFAGRGMTWGAEPVQGTYLEARTCQVYTGPCFANGEVGLAGKDAVLGWRIAAGEHAGIDLTGLSVALIVKSSHTLGFNGFADAKTLKGVIYVDDAANASQQAALRSFVLSQTGMDDQDILEVRTAPIELDLDTISVAGSLQVGNVVKLRARKARPGDCICSNESAYYPPLVSLHGSAPGVTIEGDVTARRLGTRWSIPDSRTAFLGQFQEEADKTQLATR